MLRPASIRINLLPRACVAPSGAPAASDATEPMRCGNPAHARERRYLGRSAQYIAARPFQGPQIRLDQGQRKEGHPHIARQIRHMLPARGKIFARFCTEARKHIRGIAAAVAGQQLLTAHVRGIQARLRQRQAPARERRAAGRAGAAQDHRLGRRQQRSHAHRRRARDAECPLPGQTAHPRFSTGECAGPPSSAMACAARSIWRASITSSRSGTGRAQRCAASRTASAMGLPVSVPAWGASSASRHHCSRISPMAGSRVTASGTRASSLENAASASRCARAAGGASSAAR